VCALQCAGRCVCAGVCWHVRVRAAIVSRHVFVHATVCGQVHVYALHGAGKCVSLHYSVWALVLCALQCAGMCAHICARIL
jgi:hypothetical protein